VKVYINQGQYEFFHEKNIHENLIEHPYIVKAEKCVSYDQIQQPLKLQGLEFYSYSYMTMPFSKNGSMIQLLMKAGQMGHTFSMGTVGYLFK
jgi:serine/threonine protein kinase